MHPGAAQLQTVTKSLRKIDVATAKNSVEKPEKTVEEEFESTVRNLLNTPPKLERFKKRKGATKAAPASKDQSLRDNPKNP